MPHLTPECDRIVVLGIPPSEGMEFNPMYAIRLLQMMMEIRNSEDYFRSDIYVVDYGNITLHHISKIKPSWLKKYELCALVSSTIIFYLYKENIP